MADPAHDERRPGCVQPGERARRDAARPRPGDLAPAPTDGGKTYRFQLRPNIRYSNGVAVEAGGLPAGDRACVQARSGGSFYYTGIVGGERCASSPKTCDLSRGIVADDPQAPSPSTLPRPTPNFCTSSRCPFAYAVPAGTPAASHHASAAGDRAVRHLDLRSEAVFRLDRNPHFREWSQAAQPDGYPDEIVSRSAGRRTRL